MNNYDSAYSYILGLYLGDGSINECKRTQRMRIFFDEKYPKLIENCVKYLNVLFPTNKIGVYSSSKNEKCIVVSVYNNNIIKMFPQHGKHKKHNRKIKLTKEQKAVIRYEYLIMGLFHSDGSYYVGDKNYGSMFYNFVNYSNDIIDIFKLCCKKLNITYTHRENSHAIYVCKKKDSKKLYNIIGDKKQINLL